MKEVVTTRLKDADPRGRVDVAIYRGAEKIAEHIGMGHVWNAGLGEFFEHVIRNVASSKPITPLDVAQSIGLAGRKRR